MKRSEINRYILETGDFFTRHGFYLPVWAQWSPQEWETKGPECREVVTNGLGWDITDFGSNDFLHEGLALVTLRNGNIRLDRKPYCEKIMMVRKGQVTPIHFHWKKMEDIINCGGGELCMRLWQADADEELSDKPCTVRLDGVETTVPAGETLRLAKGRSITFTPYLYHTFWAEGEDCLVGEVSTVNDDTNDNRFYTPLGRYPAIDEDEPARFLLCNEYPTLK